MIFSLSLIALLQQTTPVTVQSDSVYHARSRNTTVRMSAPVNATIEVDGKLDEAIWQQAKLLTGFSQYAPADQRPAPDSTEVRVWYSPTALHFGIRA